MKTHLKISSHKGCLSHRWLLWPSALPVINRVFFFITFPSASWLVLNYCVGLSKQQLQTTEQLNGSHLSLSPAYSLVSLEGLLPGLQVIGPALDNAVEILFKWSVILSPLSAMGEPTTSKTIAVIFLMGRWTVFPEEYLIRFCQMQRMLLFLHSFLLQILWTSWNI